MSIFNKYLCSALLSVVILQESKGQAAGSPFSTFGIGEYYGNALIHNQGMGGVGLSNPQFWYLNNQNPALLVYNNFTVFEAGIIGESRTVRAETTSERTRSGNLNYLAVAFPIRPRNYPAKMQRWTTSLGLMPFTNVDYGLEYTDDVIGNGSPITVTEEGSGGLTQFYWSNGVRITRELAVGLKASYLFGSLVNDFTASLNETSQPVPYRISMNEKTYITDFSFSAGISFSKDSLWRGNDYRLSFGAIYGFGSDLKARRTDKFLRQTLSGDLIDSVTLATLHGNLYIPQEFGLGISLAKRSKWSVGADIRYQDWSAFRSINSEDEEGLVKSWSAAIGGELTPDAFAVKNYLNRITYRAGLSYETSPFLANGQEVRDFGINFGFSLPTGRSSIDLAFKAGKRGNRSENILEENYFKLYFGLTLNEQWFIKRKFD